MSLETALAFTLAQEGGLVNNSNDPGGLTKYGISQRQYPTLDIANLTLDYAKAIYARDYWIPSGCPDLTDRIATCQFDAAVNLGVSQAVKLVQRVVLAIPDGVWGLHTKAAMDAAVIQYGEDAIVDDLLGRREIFYERLVQNNPSQGVFLKGWKARLDRLRAAIADPQPEESA